MIEDEQAHARATQDSAARAVDALFGSNAASTRHSIRKSPDRDADGMIALWDSLDGLKDSPAYAALLGTPTFRERLVELRLQWALIARSFAKFAVPAAASAVAAIYFLVPRPAYYEAGGEKRRITLADHSVVTLEPASTLRFEVKDGRRLATLAGRARFDVSHDKAHPFLIDVGDAQVQVVGTQFTLDYQRPCTQLSVVSGTVILRSPRSMERSLNAGEEAVSVDADALKAQSYRTCLTGSKGSAALRWSYIDVPLSTIISDVQPFYPAKIVLASPKLATERVTTSFRMADVGNLMNVLPDMIEADVRRASGNAIYILPKARPPSRIRRRD